MQSDELFKGLRPLKRINKDGTVLLVSKPGSSEEYALKIFPYTLSGKLSTCFRNEIRSMELKHKNVLTPFAFQYQTKLNSRGKQNNSSCVLMEFSPNFDLHYYLQPQFNSIFSDEKLIRTIFLQIIDGLEYIHSQETYHLDLKPGNILIGRDFLPKIIDFDTSSSDGYEIIGAGTDGFRAPELERDEVTNPRAADIYSLGLILLAMMTRNRNVYEDIKTELEIGFEKVWEKLECIYEEKNIDFSSSFKDLIETMLNTKPEKRCSAGGVRFFRWTHGEVYEESKLREKMMIKNN